MEVSVLHLNTMIAIDEINLIILKSNDDAT